MRNKHLIILILSIILGLTAFYFFNKQHDISTSLGVPAPDSINTPEMFVGKEPGGMYIEEYSEELLDINENQRTVLFFYASWCPTCKPVDEELKQKANLLPANTVVIRVNYNDGDKVDDSEKALANKYAITYQHTFVLIDKDGNEIKKWNGGDFSRIIAELK